MVDFWHHKLIVCIAANCGGILSIMIAVAILSLVVFGGIYV